MSRPMKASTQVKETLAAPLPHYLNFTRARGAYPSVPAPMRPRGHRSWAPQARPVRHCHCGVGAFQAGKDAPLARGGEPVAEHSRVGLPVLRYPARPGINAARNILAA